MPLMTPAIFYVLIDRSIKGLGRNWAWRDFLEHDEGQLALSQVFPEDNLPCSCGGCINVCRCEMISEGEILDAIHRPLGATTMDGIKRRTRAGMGRCQAGFCTPKTMEILERELIDQTGRDYEKRSRFRDDRGEE